MRIWGILLASGWFLLTGCQSITAPDSNNSPWYVTPQVGSYIELHQELTAPRGKRIYIQYGEARPKRDINEREPYCQFYVDRRGAEMREPLVIAKDRFMIERVFRKTDITGLVRVRYASSDDGMDFDGSPSEQTMSTYMEIFSDRQPQVTRLICSRWADPYFDNHVRINEIRESLGNLVKLVPAG
ncbi:MAG: hypothetical protein OEQ39_12940 [Gammaproteobacteria bacterium]|nr:hypothetical protein [Gammaproteobacteria bacterium]MDH3467890.1 hypothetical protein [Gammaproteobacteria bacterium]